KSARVNFYSNAALEDFEARNKTSVCVLDIKTGGLQFTTLIKGFEFENEEMQEHFNDHYLESHKFPKAEFKGAVVNNGSVNYKKPGSYPVQVKGQLTMHGITKDVATGGMIKVDAKGINTTATFNVQVSDYSIKIPSLVKDKIAKVVKITVDASLDPLK
ncbi:MAG TPA: YceI family protein, partial [Chitinophagaceae bacterium]|nr:YceI family protein [Chitinophagaceae bacterium]